MSAKILNRIITGYVPVIFLGQRCVLYDATSIIKYECDLHYDAALEEFLEEGILSKADLEKILIERKIWKPEFDEELKVLNSKIVEAQKMLPALKYKTIEKKNVMILIDQHRKRMDELNKIKVLTFKHSAEYLAEVERLRYHFFSSLTLNGQKIWKTWDEFCQADGQAIMTAMSDFSDSHNITETDIRLIARNEPWRTMWRTAEKQGGLFGKPSVEMTDYQRALCTWSLIYDAAFNSYEPPSYETINNDDEFDAWLNSKHDVKTPLKTGNPKIDNSPELGVFVDTIEDVHQVQNLNDPATKARLAARNKLIQEKGCVKEQEFSDVKQNAIMAANAKTEARKYGP